jgi:hypothetical protein
MFISDAGNVGIGTTAPTTSLLCAEVLNDGGRADVAWFANAAGGGSSDESTAIMIGAGPSVSGMQGVRLLAHRENTFSSAANSEASFSLEVNNGNSMDEALRITKDGKVGIGTDFETVTKYASTSAAGGCKVMIPFNAGYGWECGSSANARSWLFKGDVADNGDLALLASGGGAYDQTADVIRIRFSKEAGASKASGAGDWGSTSDERVKKEITILDNSVCLGVVNAMIPKKFKWKNPDLHPTPTDDDGFTYGFIAQDLENIDSMKQYVTNNAQLRPDDNPDSEYVDEDGIIKEASIGGDKAFYIGAIQELSTKNDALEARILTLENA